MSQATTSEASRSRHSRVLIMGPPGSGKRTQGVTLAQRLEVPSLSTGDLFRAAMCYETPMSARLRDTIARGGYVDDDTTNAAIDRRLGAAECAEGFLPSGSPRTAGQAQRPDALLAKKGTPLAAVVCLDVEGDKLVERLI